MNNTIVKKVFASERVHPTFGYSQSTKINFKRFPYIKTIFDQPSKEDIKGLKDYLSIYFENIDILGIWEMTILLHLFLIKDHTVYNLTGTRGSGKTATVRFLYDFLHENIKNNINNRAIIIYADLNNVGVFDSGGVRNLDLIVRGITKELRRNMVSNYTEELLHFINVTSRGKAYSNILPDFLSKLRLDAKSFAFTNFADYFQVKIQEFFDNNSAHDGLRLVFDLIRELVEQIDGDKIVYCCVDNIDHVPPNVQELVIQTILSSVNQSKVTILIPTRLITSRSSFHGALRYGSLPNSCISPKREIRNRIKKSFIDLFGKKTVSYGKYIVSDIQKASYALRISEILQCSKYKKGKFDDLINSIAGYSHIRALSLISRCFFDNEMILNYENKITDKETKEVIDIASKVNEVGYNSTAFDSFFDKLIHLLYNKALKIQNDHNHSIPSNYHALQIAMYNCLHSINDFHPILINVYQDPLIGTKRMSSILLRILEFLNLQFESNPGSPPVHIMDVISYFEAQKYSENQILYAINTLHHKDIRLLFNTGKDVYKSFKELKENNEKEIGISYTGQKMVKTLSKNLDYIGLMLTKIDTDKYILLENNLTIRMTFILRLMYDALLDELFHDDHVYNENPNSFLRNYKFYFLLGHWLNSFIQAYHALKNHKRNLIQSEDFSTQSFNQFISEVGIVRDKHNYYLIQTEITDFNKEIPKMFLNLDWDSLVNKSSK